MNKELAKEIKAKEKGIVECERRGAYSGNWRARIHIKKLEEELRELRLE